MRGTNGMTGAVTNRTALLNLLLTGYDDLKGRLARRLGSADLAGDALQDTFVRLQSVGDIGAMRSPRAYLFRVAMSLAATRRRSESRLMLDIDSDAFHAFPDEAPGPADVAESRSEIEALKRAILDLPPRRREILVAACMDEIPHRTLAERFGVTVRTIQSELKQALDHCASQVDRPVPRRRSRARPSAN